MANSYRYALRFYLRSLPILLSALLTSCSLVQHDVTITTAEGGAYYAEFVKDARFAGKSLPSNGTYTVTGVSGKQTLTWVSYNKNGYRMVLDPIDQVLDVDVKSDITILVKGSKATVQ